MTDFMDSTDEATEKNRIAALEYAKLYVSAFVVNPAGAKLLADWQQRLGNRRVPVNATIQEYAATEAVRAFVHEITLQIGLAATLDR